jgi:hypothetical protein
MLEPPLDIVLRMDRSAILGYEIRVEHRKAGETIRNVRADIDGSLFPIAPMLLRK